MTSRSTRRLAVAGLLAATALGVSACENMNPKYGLHIAESSLRIAPDFSDAVRADQAAAITNPDAQYKGVPDPATDGMRTAAAERRYVTGTVKVPPLNITQQAVQAAPPESSSGGPQ